MAERQLSSGHRYGNTKIAAVDREFQVLTQDLARAATDIDTLLDESGSSTSSFAPTNVPTNTTKTLITNEDASMDVVLTWQYVQGVIKAEIFALFWKEGTAPLSPLTVADNAVGVVPVTAQAFRFEGLNPLNNYRFGIAAGRRPTAISGTVVGNIVQPSAGGGSWADLLFGTPQYLGKIWGKEQHNFTVKSTGSFAFNYPTMGVTKDGQPLTFAAADPRYGTGDFGGFDLLVYNLNTKTVHYAHFYATQLLRTLTYDADLDRLVPVSVAGTPIVGSIDVAGKFGSALHLVSNNSTNKGYLRVPGATSRWQLARTVECWLKVAVLGPGFLVSISETNDSSGGVRVAVLTVNAGGTITASAIHPVSGTISVTTSATVGDGNWHLVTAQIADNTSLRVYIDGVLDASSGAVGLTNFAIPPANFLLVGWHTGVSINGDFFVDELIVTPGQLHGDSVGFTPPTREYSDSVIGAVDAANAGLWHFQEMAGNNEWISAFRPAKSLATLLQKYNAVAEAIGLAVHDYALIVMGSAESRDGRLNDGLPDAIAFIGGNRALFNSALWAQNAAYALVGKVLSEEGNGMERYAGRIADDMHAFAQINFQTQDADMIALGGNRGWEPATTPGLPTNNPNTLALTNTTINTGNRTHKLTWGYTQPALEATNKLADGFLVYWQNTNTANPVEHQIKLDVASRSTTFEWSLATGAVVSYAVAAYRKTTSGVEGGPKQTIAAWQNVAADRKIQTEGLEDLVVETAKIGNLQVTTAKITDLAVTTAKINDLAVTAAKIENLHVITAKIANLAVITAKIDQLAVTNAKIADLAVDNAKIANLAVETAKIANLAVTNIKIANLAVETAKINDLAVTNAKINDLSAAKITTGLLTVNPSTGGATAIFVDNAGKIRLKSIIATPSRIVFENASAVESAEVTGTSAGGLHLLPTTTGGASIAIGTSAKAFSDIDLYGATVGAHGTTTAVFSSDGIAEVRGTTAVLLTGQLRTNQVLAGAPAGAADKRIEIYNAAGVLQGRIPVYN